MLDNVAVTLHRSHVRAGRSRAGHVTLTSVSLRGSASQRRVVWPAGSRVEVVSKSTRLLLV